MQIDPKWTLPNNRQVTHYVIGTGCRCILTAPLQKEVSRQTILSGTEGFLLRPRPHSLSRSRFAPLPAPRRPGRKIAHMYTAQLLMRAHSFVRPDWNQIHECQHTCHSDLRMQAMAQFCICVYVYDIRECPQITNLNRSVGTEPLGALTAALNWCVMVTLTPGTVISAPPTHPPPPW